MNGIKYYAVEAKCGHVGRKNYIPIVFGVAAESKKEAAKIARFIPRVKHDLKDAINYVLEITYEDFLEIIKINDNDPYLNCKNIQEQRMKCNLNSRIIRHLKEDYDYSLIRKERLSLKKNKNRNEKFIEKMALIN